MSAERTAWHPPFAAHVTERAPPGFKVEAEVQLATEPLRVDLLLSRTMAEPLIEKARTLKRLWELLGTDTVTEYKSPSWPFRFGDFARLLSYLAQHQALRVARLRPDELTGVLVVPTITPSLLAELAWLGLELEELGAGYKIVVAGLYIVYIVAVGEVAEHERDAFLSHFGPMPQNDPEARRWFVKFLGKEKGQMSLEEMQGYEDMLRQFVSDLPPAHRMLGLSPEERLAGLAPEQRLAGLAPEEQILALSDEVLRGLPSTFLATLSPATRDVISRRVGMR